MNKFVEKIRQHPWVNAFLQSPLSKYFSYIALFILVGGIFLTVQQLRQQQELRGRAAGFPNGINLTLSSTKTTFQPGDIIDVDVLVDTKNLTLSAVDFTIKFATSDLQVLEVKNGPFLYGSAAGALTVVPGSPTAYGSIDNTSANGTAHMVLLSGSPLDPPERQARKGTGVLATLKVQVKSTSNANSLGLDFDPTLTDAKALEKQRDPNVPGSTAPNVIDVLTGIIFTLGSAAPNADLSFQPSSSTVTPNQQFTVDVFMNTNGAAVTASEIHLMYPDSLLTLNTTTSPPVPGSFMPVLVAPYENLGSGHAVISVGASSGTDGVTGSGTIARFTFIAKTTLSTAQLQFLREDTQAQPPIPGTIVTVFGDQDNNRTGTLTPTSITIANVTQPPNPTNTPTPTPTSSPTPIPSATPVPVVYKAILSSSQEVVDPADPPVNSSATGIGRVVLRNNNGDIYVSLNVQGLSNLTAAHIHGPAPAGSNAGVIVTLPTLDDFSNFDAQLNANQVQMLKDELLYINVHTTAYQAGEIRGQLLLTNENANSTPTPTPLAQPTNTPIPTPTLPPQATALSMSLDVPAIGNNSVGGDNPTPIRQSRMVFVELYSGTLLNQASSGLLSYNSNAGLYTGTINMGAGFTGASYTVKIRLDNTLKAAKNNVTISNGATTPLGTVSLLTGDLNSDNTLDVYDYNTIISCFGTRATEASCGGDKDIADLNDNASVDGPDYVLFLSHIRSKPKGD